MFPSSGTCGTWDCEPNVIIASARQSRPGEFETPTNSRPTRRAGRATGPEMEFFNDLFGAMLKFIATRACRNEPRRSLARTQREAGRRSPQGFRRGAGTGFVGVASASRVTSTVVVPRRQLGSAFSRRCGNSDSTNVRVPGATGNPDCMPCRKAPGSEFSEAGRSDCRVGSRGR